MKLFPNKNAFADQVKYVAREIEKEHNEEFKRNFSNIPENDFSEKNNSKLKR